MDELLSITQASHATGRSLSTLNRWIESGRLEPSRTVAGRRLYSRRDVLAAARITIHPWLDDDNAEPAA